MILDMYPDHAMSYLCAIISAPTKQLLARPAGSGWSLTEKSMTAQTGENLTYRGESVTMFTEPLESYFLMGGQRPDFGMMSTALSRGYIGSWEIVQGRLYLVKLSDLNDRDVGLDLLFPGYPERVFAHWFSGTLRVPRGKRLHYVHMGYLRVHERDEMLEFDRGVMQRTWIQDNTPAQGTEAAAGMPRSADQKTP
jgi:hypothetical protein